MVECVDFMERFVARIFQYLYKTPFYSVRPPRLTERMWRKLPYAAPQHGAGKENRGGNIGDNRRPKPGSIEMIRAPRSSSSTSAHYPDVINLNLHRHSSIDPKACMRDRAEWLRDGLEAIALEQPGLRTLALPWRLGCSDPLEDWTPYFRQIQLFAAISGIRVIVVQTSKDVILECRRQVRVVTVKAKERCEKKAMSPIERALGIAMIESLETLVLSADGVDKPKTPEIGPEYDAQVSKAAGFVSELMAGAGGENLQELGELARTFTCAQVEQSGDSEKIPPGC